MCFVVASFMAVTHISGEDPPSITTIEIMLRERHAQRQLLANEESTYFLIPTNKICVLLL
jgi:hypothetical protein